MFTINNPVAKTLPDRFTNNSVYSIFQLEKAPETGTPHLQGYLVTIPNPKNKNGYTLKWLKDNVCPFTHWEPRRGTHEQAVAYCSKVETRLEGPWTRGEWSDAAGPSKGGVKGGAVNGSKILAIKKAIDEGSTDPELYEKHFGEMLRYSKGFDRYRMTMKSKFRKWQTKAFVFYGPSGTGKSMAAAETAEANFGEDVYYLDISGDNVWWDGYTGQKCVIIEEFYGQMKIGYLLKLLDRYPLQVQTKGSYVPFLAEVVFITSNEHPTMWYGKGSAPGEPSKIPLDVLNALKRRFEGKCGTIKEFKDVIVIPQDDEPNASDLLDTMVGATKEYHESINTQADADDDVDDKVVDLTCDEVLEGPTPPNEWEEYDAEAYADSVEPSQGHMHQISLREAQHMQFVNQDDFDADFPASQNPGQTIYCDCMYGDLPCDVTAKLRRTDTTRFEVVKPPKASAAEFRKHKQIPGQARLDLVPTSLHKVNDDED